MSSKEIVNLVFDGGMPEILTRFFTLDGYGYVSTREKPVDALLFTQNQHAGEFFENHPNRKNIHLHTFAMYPDFEKKYFALSNDAEKQKAKHEFLEGLFGKECEKRIRKDMPLPAGAPLRFYPTAKDGWLLAFDKLQKYAVIQPFASYAGRDIPLPVLREAAESLAMAGFMVFILIQENNLARHQKPDFNSHHFFNEMLLPDLSCKDRICLLQGSLPMMIELIQDSNLFIGADGAFIKAAWYYQKPAIFMVPDIFLKNEAGKSEIDKQPANYFGARFKSSVVQTFESFQLNAFQAFVKKSVPV